ncbi:type IV toxin-antitoxin system AbiEi family antitoxin [Mesorhizobium sp.]|uniref:type IV toxin-antitoxin system AbiEi family antitoxin n=1 Tax=Mesorhizobium sp. TaxID=1871066 RepID=UPI0025B80415|nr:type IV toxin-antitoxin system AbiEi family antitoxin [Mesorhizobium sp.]
MAMQTTSGYEREQDLLEALVSALQQIPHAQASIAAEKHPLTRFGHKLDAEIDVVVADQELVLLIELKRTVYPRDVPQILWQLSRAKNEYAQSGNQNVVPMVVAESISAGARDLLRDEKVGFFDTGGSLFVPAKGAYLYLDRPVPKTIEKSIRSLFTGKRSQVLHALLHRHRDWVGVVELSKLAEVSPGTASETLAGLERMDWVMARGQGPSKERRLSAPSALLDEWRTQIQAAKHPLARRRYYVPGGSSQSLANRLGVLCEAGAVEYVLTQDVAAQEYAPFLSSISRVACRMAPGKAAGEVLANLEARVVTEGANLDVIETPSRGEFLFKEQKERLWLASPVQVYLDLLRNEGRSRDMAEHLRQEVLGI